MSCSENTEEQFNCIKPLENRFLVAPLESRLGYCFRNPELLITALTHSSQANLQSIPSYERLEFLGDSVLNLIVASLLFLTCPDFTPGELTTWKADWVSQHHLADLAKRIKLHNWIRVSDKATQVSEQPAILEDVMEAIIGAIYLDGGLKEAERVCKALFSPVLEKVKNGGCVTPNHKSNLQEFSLRLYGLKPTYQVESTEGPPHQRFFHVKVYIKNEIIGSGSGHSKKAAEKAAAKDACLHWCKSVEKEIS